MTEKHTELPQDSKAASTSAVPKADSGSRPAPGAVPAGKSARGVRRGGLAGPALIVAVVVALVLAAALWYQQRRFEGIAAQLQQQAASSADFSREADALARQARQQADEQAQRVQALESELADTRTELDGLQQAFQLITDSGSELVLLNDVDHLVTIAQQQLQLGGNVANAIISLETAQAQLARANRPGLASLQQTINGDLDRLRAASTIDVALLSSQLDELAKLLGDAPLIVPDDAAPAATAAPAAKSAAPAQAGTPEPSDADASWWARSAGAAKGWVQSAWGAVRQDLGAFINVRRVDDTAALLMSPDQARRFRESLRLRIMTAQLAIMMHQPGIWASETRALLEAIERRFDPQSAKTRQALKLARQFADTPIDVRLPTVDNSLRAIEALRAEHQRDEARDGTHEGAGEQPGQQPPDASDKPAGSATPAVPDTPVTPSGSSAPAPDTPPPAVPSAGTGGQAAGAPLQPNLG
ncbi:hypothetical protein GSY71_02240 [Pusillimonas sp. TS35]|nr:hypothetical protein [Pusillimonas sp. TS35]